VRVMFEAQAQPDARPGLDDIGTGDQFDLDRLNPDRLSLKVRYGQCEHQHPKGKNQFFHVDDATPKTGPHRLNLTLWGGVHNIADMDQELDLLLKQTQQLMGIARKLSDENVQLRTQLEQAREAQALMQTRMDEARTRVETALARLPIETTGEG
jgi:hypothetical protein